jgi:hypothetical protein
MIFAFDHDHDLILEESSMGVSTEPADMVEVVAEDGRLLGVGCVAHLLCLSVFSWL